MLSREFLKLVLIAFLIASPAGYYIMNQWLEEFAYRIDLSIVIFILAGAVAFAIAWATVGVESFKAARANPVDSLRNE
jgi:putative ABC transport system permease protein